MLWTVRHLWPSGARYVFNNYRAILIICSAVGLALILFSKEGVTQGDPLAMVVYGLLLILLLIILATLFTTTHQSWYADDDNVDGHLHEIHDYFVKLQELGPPVAIFQNLLKAF